MASKPNFQIDIPKRSKECGKGAEELLPGMVYYSVLTGGDGDATLRSDYCSKCWEQVMQTDVPRPKHTYWKGKVPDNKEEQRREPIDRDEQALTLLKEALDSTAEEAPSEAFVLALYLARRRRLALRKETRQQGAPISIYEVLDTEEMIPIPKIDLSQLQVHRLQHEIARKLRS